MGIGTGEDGFTEQEPHPHSTDDWLWLLGLGFGVVTLGVFAATALKKVHNERFSAACAPSVEKDNTLPMSESGQEKDVKDVGKDAEKEENTETKETPYEFVDVTPFICAGRVLGKKYRDYGAQVEILRDALDVEWIVLEKDDGYCCNWFGVFKKDGRWHLVNGYFGSCSTYDDFHDDPVEWLLSYVKNIRAFSSKKIAMMWLRETEDRSYQDIKERLLIALLDYNETPDGDETPDSSVA